MLHNKQKPLKAIATVEGLVIVDPAIALLRYYSKSICENQSSVMGSER